MAIWTYVRNEDPKSGISAIELSGGLILRIGTYANLTNEQLSEIWSSGIGIVLEEGIIYPATNAGGGSAYSNGTVIPPWIANSLYRQYQAILHEEKIYIAKIEFESGATFKEENWTLVSGGGGGSEGVKISVWAPKTKYKENQLVAHEGEILRTLREFTSGETYVF